MAIELRKKNGKLLPFLYGRYYLRNKAKVINTGVRWRGTPPLSMRDTGDAAFERSRKKAAAILRRRRDEAKALQPGARPLPIHWASPEPRLLRRDTPLHQLLSGAGRPFYQRGCSATWGLWKRGVLASFVEWAADSGLTTVRQINRAVTEAYIIHLHAPDGKGRSRTAKTIRTMKTVLALALSQLLPSGEENPFKLIHVDLREGDRTFNREPLDAKEVERLLKTARRDPLAFDLIVTGLCTGLRRGDVCRLRWDSVNLKQDVLSLVTSKTQARLYLPIMPKLRAVLKQRVLSRQDTDVFVFPEAEELLRKNPGGVTYRIKKIFTHAFASPGQTERGITAAIKAVTQTQRTVGVHAASKYDFHALRTTFVTLAINGGISMDKLRALTGHETVDIVLKHYFKPKGTDVADDLEKALPNILTHRKPPSPLPSPVIQADDPVQRALNLLLTLTPDERKALEGHLLHPPKPPQ
ncbi:MAG: tyrosine-type recombinase/integrase [Verrucomicrobiota bacterium]|jgi:integrase|nr:tyrosine-type recombinase/integrase [Verrucomicrobiota bacterium]